MHVGDEIGALQLAHDGQRGEHRRRPSRQHHRRQAEHLRPVRGAVGTAFATRQHHEPRLDPFRHRVVQRRLAVVETQRRQQRMIGAERAVGGDVHEVEPGEHRSHDGRRRTSVGGDRRRRVRRFDRRPLGAGVGDVGSDDQADRADRAGSPPVGLQPQLGVGVQRQRPAGECRQAGPRDRRAARRPAPSRAAPRAADRAVPASARRAVPSPARPRRSTHPAPRRRGRATRRPGRAPCSTSCSGADLDQARVPVRRRPPPTRHRRR